MADGFIERFDSADYRNDWYIANFEQSEKFPTAWRQKLVSVRIPSTPNQGGSYLRLELTPGRKGQPKPYFGSQLHRSGNNHYGDYEVYMRPAKGSGLVSAFFIYTGPFYDDPHDEIDFEFLGRDTTKVWINVFNDGKQMPGEWIDLDFDAAKQTALYRLEWREDSITWLVDGKVIRKVTSDDLEMPSTAGKFYLSLWSGSPEQEEWLGPVLERPFAVMDVYCVSYRPINDPGLTCAEYIVPKL